MPHTGLKWSARFSVSSTRIKQLSGDKILLPSSALEALLSASSVAEAENARRDLSAYDPYNSTTFSAYWRAESQFEDQRQQLPHPLTFRLVNAENGRVVYAGIREFSADEGEIVLSPFLKETLGVKNEDGSQEESTIINGDKDTLNGVRGPTITVHVTELPKGTFVKLRPLEAGYDVEDWKALLEQYLRQNYTTLTNGEVLLIPGGRNADGKMEEFRFLVDGFNKPEVDGICIVDTDLEVEIEALNEEQARESLKRIAAKAIKAPNSEGASSPPGEIDIFRPQHGQVMPGDYVDYQLLSWDRTQVLEVELSGEDEGNDVDLLISPLSPQQRAKPRLNEHVFADFDGRPKKRIRLEPTNVELEDAEALYISVHSFASEDLLPHRSGSQHTATIHPSRFVLRAKHPDPKEGPSDDKQISRVSPNEGDVQCENCGQSVPERTLLLHKNFCLRNNILCPNGCGQVFQKRSDIFEQHWHCPHDSVYGNTFAAHRKHDALMHPSNVLRCSKCDTKETFSSWPALARHRTTTCPAKLILCRFCHLVVAQEGDPDVPNAEALLSGLTPHELADGARTTECHICNKIVRLRDMQTHLKNHDMDRFSRPTPRPCRNVNCGRTLDVCSKSGDTRAGTRTGQGPGNEIGLCSVCFGPLYVSMYDPEGKALRRRIERRYLQQLVTGCGKGWCMNEYCKSGRQHLGLQDTITTKDALPMIKPFLDGLNHGQDHTPLHFCVDEKSQKQRAVAMMLAAESGFGGKDAGYSFEWCLGALEAEAGDLDAARVWLKNWAPTKGEIKG